MPSYFFHIRDHDDLLLDPDGLELPDIASILEECRKILGGVLAEDEPRGKDGTGRQFEIADELGRTVLVVPMSNVTPHFLPTFAL